jgi:BASS family bile acid:Na+ symporter
MEFIRELAPLFISLSLTGLVLSLGLKATLKGVLFVLQRPRKLLRAFLAVNIIPPLIAALLIAFLPFAPVVKAGILLMAIAPVSPLVHLRSLKSGGSGEYACGVYVAVALLSIIVVPVVFAIAVRGFGRDDAIMFDKMARTVIENVLIPISIGMVFQKLAPKFAARAAPFVYEISFVLFLLAFVPILGSLWRDLIILVANGALFAIAAVVLASLACGHILGGPEGLDRAALAIASSTRHPGVAIMIVDSTFQNRDVEAAVLLYTVVGLVAGMLYKIWIQRSSTPTAR